MNLPEYCKSKGLICAIWCIDSESGKEYLMDLYNNCKIAERVNGHIIDPDSYKEEPSNG